MHDQGQTFAATPSLHGSEIERCDQSIEQYEQYEQGLAQIRAHRKSIVKRERKAAKARKQAARRREAALATLEATLDDGREYSADAVVKAAELLLIHNS